MRLANKNYVLWRDNPSHPGLQFKKVGRFWSVRVGLQHRALSVEAEDGTLVWFWIGQHDEYDRLIAG